MLLGCTTCHTCDSTSCLSVPIGCAKSCKGRNDVHSVGVGHFFGVSFRFGCRLDHAHFITQPLIDCTADEYASFQYVLGFLIGKACRQGRNKTVFTLYSRVTCVHQQETTCTVGVLDVTLVYAQMSEQCRLLISYHTANGDGSSDKCFISASVVVTAGVYLRQHTTWYVKQFQQFVVPIQCVDVEQHCTAGVCVVCSKDFAFTELPHDVGVNSAEHQFASFGTFSCTLYVVKNPLDLSCGKIRIDYKTRLVVDFFRPTLLFQLVAVIGSTSALPHNGVVDGRTCNLVPHKSCFTLVGDTDCGNICDRYVSTNQSFYNYSYLRTQYVVRVMFHPSRLGVNLRKFLLCLSHDFTLFIEDDCT